MLLDANNWKISLTSFPFKIYYWDICFQEVFLQSFYKYLNFRIMKTKLIILVFALIAMSFVSSQNINAQTPVNYSFWVEWNDEECDGGTILEKELTFSITYIPTQTEIDSGERDVTSTSNPYEVEDDGPIFPDCPGCYLVYARVRYRDSGGWFCSGTDSQVASGDDLINGDVDLYIVMD